MVVYGFWMGTLCLMSFVIVVFGFGDGNLGADCNEGYSPQCNLVFRARATTFSLLTWTILLFAWECKHFERSLFRLIPKQKPSPFNFIRAVYNNKFLFWAVVLAFVSVFPVVYIPVLNERVFKHKPISWEWAVVFGGLVLFLLGVELWKYAKRVLLHRGDNVGNLGRRVRSVITDERRVSSNADPAYMLEKPHFFGCSTV
jgi:Na+-exporting ATPase